MDSRSLLIGAAAGSAIMFMLDPNRGRRRRALVRDQLTRATRTTRDGLDATARDLANRAGGIVAATRGRFSAETVGDATLAQRVRAKLGRACSHPRAIDVAAHAGEVTLRGPILASEVAGVVAAVRAVRGVTAVTDEMEVHEQAEGVPALQGGGRMPGPSVDIVQRNWAPATRAAIGAGLLATGLWMAVNATRASHDWGYSHGAM